MSLAFLHDALAIATFFNEQNLPRCKMVNLGHYLGIIDITRNFKGLDWYFVA